MARVFCRTSAENGEEEPTARTSGRAHHNNDYSIIMMIMLIIARKLSHKMHYNWWTDGCVVFVIGGNFARTKITYQRLAVYFSRRSRHQFTRDTLSHHLKINFFHVYHYSGSFQILLLCWGLLCTLINCHSCTVCACTVASAVSGRQSAAAIERQSAIDVTSVPAPNTEWSDPSSTTTHSSYFIVIVIVIIIIITIITIKCHTFLFYIW